MCEKLSLSFVSSSIKFQTNKLNINTSPTLSRNSKTHLSNHQQVQQQSFFSFIQTSSFLPLPLSSSRANQSIFSLRLMGSSRSNRLKLMRSSIEPLTPLMEGPDLETLFGGDGAGKKESPWEAIRSWVRVHKGVTGSPISGRPDLRLLLGVLGCPLAPVPLHASADDDPIHHLPLKDSSMETSAGYYIVQQYLAATGCLKRKKCVKNMYVAGTVKMVCHDTDTASGKRVKSAGSRSGETGCFVLWQMSPGMWSIELAIANSKIVAGSNGKIVWRHTPWLGTHAAKGPKRPLRRIIQGLDPKMTASLFSKAQCLGEKRINDEDCFVLKVASDRDAVMERSEGPAEVIRHVLYGYFSQRSGLLIYMEDSHLTRVQTPETDTVYWETTIGSSIGDYRYVDDMLIAHQGSSVATLFRFGEVSMQNSRTRMEEVWRIDDVEFDVPGLAVDHFIPPSDIFDAPTHSP